MLAPDERTFADKKREGDHVAELLAGIFRRVGCHVDNHQKNRDRADDGGGQAARIEAPPQRSPNGAVSYRHIKHPDLTVISPQHLRIGVEVRSKSPRDKYGDYGWEQDCLENAQRWFGLAGIPVFYAVRDKSIAEIPYDSEVNPVFLDSLGPYHIASIAKLKSVVPKVWKDWNTGKVTLYWPASVFTPLSDFLPIFCIPRTKLVPSLFLPGPEGTEVLV